MSGKIWVVGFGPGSFEHITERARRAIDESDVIIGYKTYIDLILGLLNGQEIVRTGMTEEVSRAQKAVALAREGKRVAVISSGDAGIYGMAGLVYEVLVEQGWQEGDNPEVEVVPGISAINSCAALLGAPVMHDACLISLSDHLTPWDVIARRLRAAAEADFVVALYNPRSGRRTRQIVEAQRIFLEYRAPSTPVGLVKSAYRERQQIVRTTLGDMLNHEIGMLTTVIIGNSSTFYHGSLMITPRGYQRKYSLDKLEQRLRPGERLRPENEPWALGAGPSLAAIAEEALDRVTQAQAASTGGLTWTAALAEPKGVRNLAQPAETAATPGAATATPAALPASSGAPGAASEPASGPAANLSNRASATFEVAVAPGVANKKFSPAQLALLAELAGDGGELEYTPAHQLILRVPTAHPEQVVVRLRKAGLWVFPTGDVVKVKACDFCDGDKADGIPYAEEIARRLAGLKVEKELRIGYNGCAMACYGAVSEDIAVVFRKGRCDLFLGGKTTGRNAHPAQRVAEGIPAEEIPGIVERIVQSYRDNAFPGERFHKYFERVGEIWGFRWVDAQPVTSADAVCGN